MSESDTFWPYRHAVYAGLRRHFELYRAVLEPLVFEVERLSCPLKNLLAKSPRFEGGAGELGISEDNALQPAVPSFAAAAGGGGREHDDRYEEAPDWLRLASRMGSRHQPTAPGSHSMSTWAPLPAFVVRIRQVSAHLAHAT